MDDKSKKIAKNSIYLYIRMAILMCITFYTSRVVLDKLGIEDFGIYNVISSIAITFTFFSSALTNATQRFITIELGKEDLIECNNVFNQHLIVYSIICGITLIVAEILGVWYINNKLNIPPDRLIAAHYSFQFAILTVVAAMLSVVFESLVISHEDMKQYSYVGVTEGILKLLVAYALTIAPFEKLIFYSLLMAVVTVSCKLYYMLYSFKHYKECYLKWCWNLRLIKKTFSFVGWNIVSTAQAAVSDQGVNLLLNLYLGPAVNAARGVTSQVSGAVFRFSTDILVAIQPQMVKSYARGDMKYLEQLFYNASRFSYLLLWILACPVLFCIQGILNIWLVEVPEWTVPFVQLSLIGSLIYILTKPIWSIIIAVGELKKYVLITSFISIMVFPMSYVLLEAGFNPTCVYICSCIVTLTHTISQLIILHGYVNYSYKSYVKKVIKPIFLVSSLTLLFSFYIPSLFDKGLMGTLSASVAIFIISLIFACFVGLNKGEREIAIQKIKAKFPK